MRTTGYIITMLAITSFFCAAIQAQGGADTPESRKEAQMKYMNAKELYDQGEYEECKQLLDSYIYEFLEKDIFYPVSVRSDIYVLRAMVSFVFLTEGYQEEIRFLFLQAIRLDLGLELDDPTVVPPRLIKLFNEVKTEYLARFSRTTKRHNIGIITSLVKHQDTLLSIIQPGLHYAYNLSEDFSLVLDARVQLTARLLENFSVQGGIIWIPEFRIEQVVFGLSTYYIFSLDNYLENDRNYYGFTHSLGLCGHGEVIWRIGLGLAAEVEIVRLDLMLGSKTSEITSGYDSIDIIPDMLRFLFANLNIYLFFNF
ncbi:MAG: hypothetical protein JW881_08515 [Spirochaetales bacterium]|nr:hypothetical protein [Spirochaetales bacterium]